MHGKCCTFLRLWRRAAGNAPNPTRYDNKGDGKPNTKVT